MTLNEFEFNFVCYDKKTDCWWNDECPARMTVAQACDWLDELDFEMDNGWLVRIDKLVNGKAVDVTNLVCQAYLANKPESFGEVHDVPEFVKYNTNFDEYAQLMSQEEEWYQQELSEQRDMSIFI